MKKVSVISLVSLTVLAAVLSVWALLPRGNRVSAASAVSASPTSQPSNKVQMGGTLLLSVPQSNNPDFQQALNSLPANNQLSTSQLISLANQPGPTQTNSTLPGVSKLSVQPQCKAAPSDANCTGQDPHVQQCDLDAVRVFSAEISWKNTFKTIGYVYIDWSAACQSNWTKALTAKQSQAEGQATPTSTTKALPSVIETISVIRQDGKTESYDPPAQYSQEAYTNMVYAPNPTASTPRVRAKACAEFGIVNMKTGHVVGHASGCTAAA
jgi:hypothetical protein